jgi:hypothetical protein
MRQETKIFRIFVSSTFSDLVEERNALHEYVFPRLRKQCQKNGARLQVIDLRWGVSEEAAMDQQTMNICLEELHRCQQTTPRPNFILLLGQRYGWCPLPPQIQVSEFELLRDKVKDIEEIELLNNWYRRDNNAVSPEYCLQPRKLFVSDDVTIEHRKTAIEFELNEWFNIEKRIRAILLQAIHQLGWLINDTRRIKYEASATHQEILEGALKADNATASVFAYFRNIVGLPENEYARGYCDFKVNTIETEAYERLLVLKSEIKRALPDKNVYKYSAKWLNNKPVSDLQSLCERVERDLQSIIKDELFSAGQKEKKELSDESNKTLSIPEIQEIIINEQIEVGLEKEQLSPFFSKTLKKIADYLATPYEQALFVIPDGPANILSLLSLSIQRVRKQMPSARIFVRFIGAIPNSSDGKILLIELCDYLGLCYGESNPYVMADEQELFAEFRKRLRLAGESNPIILFFDGLDELKGSDAIRKLDWLPKELPYNTHFVASINFRNCLPLLKTKISEQNQVHIIDEFSNPDAAEERITDMIGNALYSAGRTLQHEQYVHVLQKLKDAMESHFLPLYVRIFQKFALVEITKWQSYDGIPEYNGKVGFASDLNGIMADFLWRLSRKKQHDPVLVTRCLGYLVASRFKALAEDELIDILSKDVDVYERFIKSSFHIPPDFEACVRKYLLDLQSDSTTQPSLLQTDNTDVTTIISNLLQDDKRLRPFLNKILSEPDAPSLPIIIWARLHYDLAPYLITRKLDGTHLRLIGPFHRALCIFLEEKFLPNNEIKKCHRRLADYFQIQLHSIIEKDDPIIQYRIIPELEFHKEVIKSWDSEINSSDNNNI